MSSLGELFALAINILIIGTIIHWIAGFFGESTQPEVNKARGFLDRIYEPMLEIVRSKVSPFTLSDGRSFDLSHLILIIVFAVGRRLVLFLF